MVAMPHKDRDKGNETDERSSERHRHAKSEKDPNRQHKSSKSSRAKVIDPDTGEYVKSPSRRRREKEGEAEMPASMTDLVPELSRTASAPGATSRSSLPYPSFNKAYSRETLHISREDVSVPPKSNANPYPTPESTYLGSEKKHRSRSVENLSSRPSNTKDGRPPSPPETEFSQQRKATPSRMSKVKEDVETESRSSSMNSWFGRTSKKEDQSIVSTKSKGSKASTAVKASRSRSTMVDKEVESPTDRRDSEVDSNATRKAGPGSSGERLPNLDTYSSPESAQDSSPKTPTQTPHFSPPSAADVKLSASPFPHFEPNVNNPPYPTYPPPPPPPPPPTVPINPPRVDYLIQNGGLLRPVPKTLLAATPSFSSVANIQGSSTPPLNQEVQKIFGPYFNVLDQYETVINKNGSLAVATGYRSVARRLLDKLGNVFARDLPPDGCLCVMCQRLDLDYHEGSRGLGWGEVLEWVSGRRELPSFPAFDFAALGVKSADDLAGLGISSIQRPGSPIKIDPDIAEEFREHYLQQSKKTKKSVDRWLSSCPETSAAPPQEVDDETLSFAILTHLEQHDRPIFNALLSGSTVLQPMSRSPTPLRRPRSDFMIRTVQSIQRLYRLPLPPRDPEAAIYLLKNPQVHNLLATLSGIVPSEWEILVSGRFDGFLWSGADSESVTTESPTASRGPTPLNASFRGPSPAIRMGAGSRNNTPFSPMRSQTFSPGMSTSSLNSRGPTPSQQSRYPVSNDEEMEIAVLAEIEREIYLGMEALEDAFEGLHRKAEFVRQALRQRGAGLSMASEARRSSQPSFFGSPASQYSGMGPGYERPSWQEGGSESEWDAGDDNQSEIAPDDSASNISSSRHRRPKRRNERRTPALLEEDED